MFLHWTKSIYNTIKIYLHTQTKMNLKMQNHEILINNNEKIYNTNWKIQQYK